MVGIGQVHQRPHLQTGRWAFAGLDMKSLSVLMLAPTLPSCSPSREVEPALAIAHRLGVHVDRGLWPLRQRAPVLPLRHAAQLRHLLLQLRQPGALGVPGEGVCKRSGGSMSGDREAQILYAAASSTGWLPAGRHTHVTCGQLSARSCPSPPPGLLQNLAKRVDHADFEQALVDLGAQRCRAVAKGKTGWVLSKASQSVQAVGMELLLTPSWALPLGAAEQWPRGSRRLLARRCRCTCASIQVRGQQRHQAPALVISSKGGRPTLADVVGRTV